MTTYKIYFCSKCDSVTKDETKCPICGRTQLEIGLIEIKEKGEQ